MKITFENFDQKYLTDMTETWNQVLMEGVAFPGEDLYTPVDFEDLLAEQSQVTCMLYDGKFAGFYILHPNNIGRCGHVANASYCIAGTARGKGGFSQLVAQSLKEAKALGFKGMQFNAVVANNFAALHTYEKNNFQLIGTIPAGFRLKDGIFSDMHILYTQL